MHTCSYYCDRPECVRAQRDELRQKLEQAEKQEPFAVAWVLDGELFWPSEYEVISQAGDKAIPLYTAPVHAIDISQEGWVLREVYFSEGEPISHREPQWVGLTDYELPEGETYDFDRGVRWAEAKLKEKNCPSAD